MGGSALEEEGEESEETVLDVIAGTQDGTEQPVV